MTWNANGLLQHKENLIVTLVDHKIDVCLISETLYQRIIDHTFDLYYTMHPNNCARSGSAVIVKKEISPHEDIKIE
jgi:exonuclease III